DQSGAEGREGKTCVLQAIATWTYPPGRRRDGRAHAAARPLRPLWRGGLSGGDPGHRARGRSRCSAPARRRLCDPRLEGSVMKRRRRPREVYPAAAGGTPPAADALTRRQSVCANVEIAASTAPNE